MTTHVERTASAPRQTGLHAVKVSRIQQVSPSVRLITLALPVAIQFLPGQWVDLHIPSLPSPGGFTITSSPTLATEGPSCSSPSSKSSPFTGEPAKGASLGVKSTLDDQPLQSRLLATLRNRNTAKATGATTEAVPRPLIELAIQKTSNPPAKWLWQPFEDIVGVNLEIRIGGSFTWPPPRIAADKIGKLIFIAGGVGINPFMSMLSRIYENHYTIPKDLRVLYSVKAPEDLTEILFLERLAALFESTGKSTGRMLDVYLTGSTKPEIKEIMKQKSTGTMQLHLGRMSQADISSAAEPERGLRTISYVCGPGAFVDNTVTLLSSLLGVENVFQEKWW